MTRDAADGSRAVYSSEHGFYALRPQEPIKSVIHSSIRSLGYPSLETLSISAGDLPPDISNTSAGQVLNLILLTRISWHLCASNRT